MHDSERSPNDEGPARGGPFEQLMDPRQPSRLRGGVEMTGATGRAR